MRILLVDVLCPEPYGSNSIESGGLGGSEASVIRVAKGLYERGHDIRVVQHNRETVESVFYTPALLADGSWVPDVIISFRSAMVFPFVRKLWPNAKNILWLTDIVGTRFWQEFELVTQRPTTIVGLSDFHLSGIKKPLEEAFEKLKQDVWRNISLRKIALPIDDSLTHDPTIPVNPNKLIFFSSPIKGLTETLELFNWYRQREPKAELHISNPGYGPSSETTLPGVVNHGVLTHAQALAHVREAALVFYGNMSFPETFGLVFAEANAVGTPVVAYDMGSAGEVLAQQGNYLVLKGEWERFLHCVKEVSEMRKQGTGTATTSPKYRLTEVLNMWEKLLDET